MQVKFNNFGDEVRALKILASLRDDLVVDLADKGEKIRVGLVVVGLVLDQHNEVKIDTKTSLISVMDCVKLCSFSKYFLSIERKR